MPFSSVYFFAAIAQSSNVSPINRISIKSSPNIFVWFTFWLGVIIGMKTTPFTFSFLQEKAKPCAWLPALAHTTPRCNSSAGKLLIILYAPRSLYERTTCRSSRFRYTLHWYFFDRLWLYISGVLFTTFFNRNAAL